MATSYQSKLPNPNNLLNILDANNPKCTSGSGNLKDGIKGLEWQRITTVTDTLEDNIKCFDMNGGYLEKSGGVRTFGQYYTCFYLWKPREADNGQWRTLHRNDNDHIGIIRSTDKILGMYSNRNGGFISSGYDIAIEWQTLIITGEGDGPTATTGTTTYYVNGVNVGTSNRVGCGTYLYRIGWASQHPGYMSVMGSYDKKLNATEIEELHNHLYKKIQL
jgi:hypothetical protein